MKGRYSICLMNKGSGPAEIKFELAMGVESAGNKKGTEKASGEELRGVERQIAKLNDMSKELGREMGDLRKTSNDEQAVSSSTTVRVIVFGVLSIGIIVGAGVVQILYLRRFFRMKKIV